MHTEILEENHQVTIPNHAQYVDKEEYDMITLIHRWSVFMVFIKLAGWKQYRFARLGKTSANASSRRPAKQPRANDPRAYRLIMQTRSM
jgi:hypothetical protein